MEHFPNETKAKLKYAVESISHIVVLTETILFLFSNMKFPFFNRLKLFSGEQKKSIFYLFNGFK